MKKAFLIWLLIIATAQIVAAQSNIVSGSVKDEKGNPLHFVFVVDNQYKNAAYTDSLGSFTISVNPDSKLQFELPGYKSVLINEDKSNAMQVVLTSLGSGSDNLSGADNAPSSQIIVQNTGNSADATVGTGGVISPSHQKGNLRGNQYLFDTFVHGYVISSSDQLIYKPDYLFAYDKMGGALLLTRDKKNITEVSRDQTKSFILYNSADERFEFEKVPAIDKSHYVQVLASGKKYKIYKLTKTKFVKSDYVNNGVTQHGNDYDEYVDEADYYVLNVQGNQLQKLTLRKKSIKEDFAKDADKVNKYLSDNSGSIDDVYLGKLGTYMNQ
jgi:hypothetical protein